MFLKSLSFSHWEIYNVSKLFSLFEGRVNACFSYFCSTNGQYVKQGKFGAAVLGNHTTREVRIPPCLIYIQVTQIIPVNWFLWGLVLYIRELEWLYLMWFFNVRCIMVFIVTFCLLLCIKTNSTTQIPWVWPLWYGSSLRICRILESFIYEGHSFVR